MINLDDRIAARLSENLMKTKIFWHLAKSFSLSFFFLASAYSERQLSVDQLGSGELNTKATQRYGETKMKILAFHSLKSSCTS